MPIAVSVIVPFFNVEAFIGACAHSLMKQTLRSAEYIFVDDASADGSRSILESVLSEYPWKDTRILTHNENKGLPAARNTGMAAASGKYVYHCDSDDWLDPVMLERMYAAAEGAGADYVWCDFFLASASGERHMRCRDYKDPRELLRKGYMAGDMKYNVWNKLVRRSLYEDNGIEFPSKHSMGEDMTMILLAACSEAVAYVPQALYHYNRTNGAALTSSYTERKLSDIKFNADRVVAYLSAKYGESMSEDIMLFELNVKLPFLLTGSKEDYLRWQEWYPESNAFIFANKELPFRTKLVQWCAARRLWLLVRVYASLLSRLQLKHRGD